jgi:hypothetical protein
VHTQKNNNFRNFSAQKIEFWEKISPWKRTEVLLQFQHYRCVCMTATRRTQQRTFFLLTEKQLFLLSFISEHYAPTELIEITHVFVITIFFSSAVWLFPQEKSLTWVSSFFPRILEPWHKQWQTNKAKKKTKEAESYTTTGSRLYGGGVPCIAP